MAEITIELDEIDKERLEQIAKMRNEKPEELMKRLLKGELDIAASDCVSDVLSEGLLGTH